MGYTVIPVEREQRGNQLIVYAKLNGKPRRFAVDTGWGVTGLDKEVGRELKTLGELGVTLQDSFLGKLTNDWIVLMDRLEIGKAQFLNQPAKPLAMKADHVQVLEDGILGCDFLVRNHGLLSCQDRRLYVRGSAPSSNVVEALAISLQRIGFSGVPLEFDGSSLIVSVSANGQPMRLVVDTGGVFTMVDDDSAKRVGLKTKIVDASVESRARREQSFKVVGLDDIGTAEAKLGVVKKLEIGSWKATDVDIGIGDLKAWGLGEPTLEGVADGILGADVLRSVKAEAIIDCSARRLWLRGR